METGKTLQKNTRKIPEKYLKYLKIPERYLKKYLRKITREQAKLETKQDKNNANDKKAV